MCICTKIWRGTRPSRLLSTRPQIGKRKIACGNWRRRRDSSCRGTIQRYSSVFMVPRPASSESNSGISVLLATEWGVEHESYAQTNFLCAGNCSYVDGEFEPRGGELFLAEERSFAVDQRGRVSDPE